MNVSFRGIGEFDVGDGDNPLLLSVIVFGKKREEIASSIFAFLNYVANWVAVESAVVDEAVGSTVVNDCSIVVDCVIVDKASSLVPANPSKLAANCDSAVVVEFAVI